MAKALTSFRIESEWLEWLDETAKTLGTTKAALLGDALSLVAQTNNAAADNLTSMWQALGERFGEDAEVVTWVDIEEDGLPVVRVRVDGEEHLGFRGHATIDESRGRVHVFWEIDGWAMVRYGSAYVGPTMLATLPLRSVATFPWPPDPDQKQAAVARIGDAIHGGARSPERDPAA